MDPTTTDALITAGSALSRHGLVDAFGHVSTRTPDDGWAMTRGVPLDSLGPEDVRPFDPGADTLGPDLPKEGWIHRAVVRARPDAGAVCRAQPPTATALASAGVPIVPLHGQGAFLGPEVPVHEDPRLVRDPGHAERLAHDLGGAPAVLMRGNGAVTVGATVAEAVALMWVLERSAVMNATASAAGTPRPLDEDEQRAWREAAPELCRRIWLHLANEETPRRRLTRP
ncbi:class II aldolase/adducin family protein [Nocardiopsis sp. NPDC006938]|uniref:class II aldolase/adducin family protein n=1 Tax=Nocardiopsis sp. NPDC006938 TaxID=3364337 RepID=UPI0036CB2441